MKPLKFDTLPTPTATAIRPRPANIAIDDWQRAWDESGLPGGSGSNPTAEANRNDSVGLKSDLQLDTPTDEVTPFVADGSNQTCSAVTAECWSEFSPTPLPESGTAVGLKSDLQLHTEAGNDDQPGTATLPPLQGEGRGEDGGRIDEPISRLPLPTSSAEMFEGRSDSSPTPPPESGTAIGQKSDLQPATPRPLKAGQLAWQSTQAMAQRARRNDESGEIQSGSLQQSLAPLAAPMLAPPLPPAAPQLPGELLLAAVERMLITEPDGDGAQQVHLTFADDWFNETAVTLSRTDGGWRLDIASASPRITAALRGACNELGSRFAQRGLGRLDARIRTTRNWDALEEAT